MSLTIELIDAVIDGLIGRGLLVTRQEVISYFASRPEGYTGVILSNSELDASHSPTYEKFSLRVDRGVYRIHPDILAQRMRDRGLI